VRPRTQLSVLQIVTWAALGLTGGVVLGFALAEWTGNVTAPRVRRAARRIREPAPPPALTAAGTARAVADALGRDAELHDLGIQVTMVSAGTVELHGWVRTRALRARAARVAARVPGVEAVINSILVRGEDDRTYLPDYLATDQSA
jgi:BON domain-containing protein